MCSVLGCNSWRRRTQRFKLPEDPERRLEWVQFILEVNDQRLKESSWTDITICRNHFTEDCFINQTETGTIQLKSSAVPSLSIKSEPDEPDQEPIETKEVASQCDIHEACDSPSSYSDESGVTSTAAQGSPAPSEASDVFMSDGRTPQNIVNIDMIMKKAALLQIKGKYVVNEKRLLELFSHKCPLCGSKVKTEKVTFGVLIILNQQCIKCKYRKHWKSQVNGRVPTAEDEHLTEVVEVDLTPETQQTGSTDDIRSTVTGMFEIDAVIDERSDSADETEESSDEGDMDSDEDWNPAEKHSLANKRHEESNQESEDEEEDEEKREEYDDYPSLPVRYSQLCTECGKFVNKHKPHTCEHKIKPYSCNICGKRCVSEVALNFHSRIHNENYEFKCKFCHATFKTKAGKFTHQEIHVTEGKPYKCPDCSETFATNKERSIHLEDHRGPRQSKCHICGVEFRSPPYLQRHLAVHTGEKPFKCSVCDRGFNQASHLKSHMRLHTGERPFKCQHCDKCFNHNVSLKSHVQRYHTPNSGREQKKGKRNKTVSSAADAEDNGCQRGADSGLHNVEERDKAVEVQERIKKPLNKSRSTGRPIGRPKKKADNLVLAGEMQGRCSNTKTAKVKVRKIMNTHSSGEESEDEPTEENSETVTLSTS
ncbi:zinc finger protein 852-like [Plectropomus leopardus]|uniref:zinc finger protein 852-like n=1 Tax=Plectropomus leopardus TaxID=160734 RepID=UPI001C4CA90D|nr:zinc finger protein 852-like [Plectropomus leopardus]